MHAVFTRMLNTRSKMMIASVCYRVISILQRLRGKNDRVFVARNGLHWHLDISEGIDLSIYLFGSFEREVETTAASILRDIKKPVILDIGANIGSQTMPLARIARNQWGVVHAFEPTEWACRKLMQNFEANPGLTPFVHVHQCFVTRPDITEIPAVSSASWSLSERMEGRNDFMGIEKSTRGSDPVSIDGFMQAQGIDAVHFIKLDVDGYEADVLDGAMHCLSTSRPAILMEWAPYLDQDERLRHRIDRLLKDGYILTIPGKRRNFPSLELLHERVPVNGGIQILLTYGSI